MYSPVCESSNKVHNVAVMFKISAGVDLKVGDASQGSYKIGCIYLSHHIS